MPDNSHLNATHRWLGGGHDRTVVGGDLQGVGQEQPAPATVRARVGRARGVAGPGPGADPVEHLLNALAACVTSARVYHAAARGLEIEALESRTEGHIDLRGFLGIDDGVPRGYQHIQITFKIKAKISDEQLEELVNLGPTYSPVFDTVIRAVPVDVGVERS